MYERPVLCRLCRRPVADTGVRMSELDVWKLAKWWPKLLKTEFDEERLEEHLVCQFCLWDAKYERHEEKESDCDWWTGHDTNQFYEKCYYQDETIRPCEVKIFLMKSQCKEAVNVNQDVLRPLKFSKKCKKVKCSFCCLEFQGKARAALHVRAFHNSIEKFFCMPCRTYIRKDAKIQHVNEVHSKGFRCLYCPTNFTCYRKKNFHMRKAHHNCLIKCHICAQYFKSISEKDAHFMSKHTKLKTKTNCIYCNKQTTIHSLRQHISCDHADVAIRCPYRLCNTYYFNDAAKQEHVLKEHEAKDNLEQCVICKLLFPCGYILPHMRSVHQHDTYFRCNFNSKCPKYFLTEAERNNHLLEYHVIDNVFKCVYCTKTCINKQQLKRHVHLKHAHEKIGCKHSRCSKYFLSAADMLHHYQTRHGSTKKIFKCNDCNFSTRQRCNLIKHIRFCHLIEAFKCSKCRIAFTTEASFSIHLKSMHSPRECPHCKLVLPRKTMYQHLQGYMCMVCEKRFCLRVSRQHEQTCK